MEEILRIKDRAEFPELMRKLFGSKNVCAEVGVANGDYSFYWLKHADVYEVFFLVDTWKKELWFRTGETDDGMDRKYILIQSKALTISRGKAVVLRAHSVNAAREMPDGSFTFVYVDASHDYKSVKADLEAWYPKVRPGGILAGHDIHMEEVRRAVDELCKEHNLELVRVTRETDPSWLVRKAAC